MNLNEIIKRAQQNALAEIRYAIQMEYPAIGDFISKPEDLPRFQDFRDRISTGELCFEEGDVYKSLGWESHQTLLSGRAVHTLRVLQD